VLGAEILAVTGGLNVVSGRWRWCARRGVEVVEDGGHVEDPGPLERCLGVPVLVAVAEGGVLRASTVGHRVAQDDRFVLGRSAGL
jgi:hypothetical protein